MIDHVKLASLSSTTDSHSASVRRTLYVPSLAPLSEPAMGFFVSVVPGTLKRSVSQSDVAMNENSWPAAVVGSGTVGRTPLIAHAAFATREPKRRRLTVMTERTTECGFIGDLRLTAEMRRAHLRVLSGDKANLKTRVDANCDGRGTDRTRADHSSRSRIKGAVENLPFPEAIIF
jgi:hypothetical protein